LEEPPPECYEEAKKLLTIREHQFKKLHSLDELKECLRGGRPVLADLMFGGEAYSKTPTRTGKVLSLSFSFFFSLSFSSFFFSLSFSLFLFFLSLSFFFSLSLSLSPLSLFLSLSLSFFLFLFLFFCFSFSSERVTNNLNLNCIREFQIPKIPPDSVIVDNNEHSCLIVGYDDDLEVLIIQNRSLFHSHLNCFFTSKMTKCYSFLKNFNSLKLQFKQN
jgi:hypothetical protein